MKKTQPYWNFSKVILAGWIIRYPRTFFNLFFGTAGFLAIMIYNAIKN
jgi:hypothetical protein